MRLAPHSHDELHLSLVLRGSLSESVGSGTESAGPLSIVSKDPGVQHANAFGAEGAMLARLSVKGLGLRDLADEPRRSRVWTWVHDVAIAAPFLALVQRNRARAGHVMADDTDVADLVAAMTSRPVVTQGEPPAWLREAVAGMREGWRPRLTVADVARDAGVHAVYLARCMRRWYGTTIGAELRRLRLRHAVRALSSPGRSVSQVAHECGFADEPHLCRTLRSAAAITPRRLRAVMHVAHDFTGRTDS
jgi:AraC family transcriptional regulator